MKNPAFLAALVAGLLLAQVAAALEGPVLLGFGEPYERPDGATATHRGADLGMPAGSQVPAPRDGTVTFVGRVPASTGGTVLAVTIESAAGAVSLLPLASACVSKGEQVAESDAVGTLAASGDASSAQPHLHVGLRRGDVYLDPATLLSAAPPLPAEEPAVEPEPALDAEPVPSAAAPSAGLSVAPGVAPAPAALPAGSAVGEPASAVNPVGDTADGGTRVASPTGELSAQGAQADSAAGLPAGVSLAAPAAEPGPATIQHAGAGDGGPLVPSATQRAALRTQSAAIDRSGSVRATGSPRVPEPPRAFDATIGAPAVGLLGAAVCAACIVFTRRALTKRIVARAPVSDRLGNLLQHLKAGDTLCGLTSCSGPTAFTVPGPLAQRR